MKWNFDEINHLLQPPPCKITCKLCSESRIENWFYLTLINIVLSCVIILFPDCPRFYSRHLVGSVTWFHWSRGRQPTFFLAWKWKSRLWRNTETNPRSNTSGFISYQLEYWQHQISYCVQQNCNIPYLQETYKLWKFRACNARFRLFSKQRQEGH